MFASLQAAFAQGDPSPEHAYGLAAIYPHQQRASTRQMVLKNKAETRSCENVLNTKNISLQPVRQWPARFHASHVGRRRRPKTGASRCGNIFPNGSYCCRENSRHRVISDCSSTIGCNYGAFSGFCQDDRSMNQGNDSDLSRMPTGRNRVLRIWDDYKHLSIR